MFAALLVYDATHGELIVADTGGTPTRLADACVLAGVIAPAEGPSTDHDPVWAPDGAEVVWHGSLN